MESLHRICLIKFFAEEEFTGLPDMMFLGIFKMSSKYFIVSDVLSGVWKCYFSPCNVRAQIQFWRESQLQHHKKWFFIKNRPIRFQINSTSVIRPVKQNQQSFSAKIQVQKPILVVAT